MKRPQSSRANRWDTINRLVSLGVIYMEDGAWRTAADRLEHAAKLLREGAAEAVAP